MLKLWESSIQHSLAIKRNVQETEDADPQQAEDNLLKAQFRNRNREKEINRNNELGFIRERRLDKRGSVMLCFNCGISKPLARPV
jgi:hypothetical protein